MKKKVFIFVFLVILIGIGVFFYIYKDHRDIAAEKEDFSITANDIFSEFKKNENIANNKYLDKTIEVAGQISNIDVHSKSLVVDEKLFVILTNNIPETVKPTSKIKIKGRFIGYDSLLEELKMDQCVIVKP